MAEPIPPPASGRNWSYSFWQFWTPVDTCLMAWCCPCILFGKTQARIADPSLANYSPINDNCLLWCGLSCFNASFLIQAKKRDDLRKKYGISETHLERVLGMPEGGIQAKHGIEGSFVEDLAGAFCCRCCGLVQEEKEVLRAQGQGQGQQGEGYQKTRGMQYP
ncbi:PLAC8 family-domain-containing protein [Aspergillus karnatakaensis]|uniref:PLAC8 family protein n=1 Tax=Aspergillus karnatakaensis TaxID=1810916 RepID=UPI003CCD014B